MKEDKLLAAVERVAVGHGLPHPAKTGLGLSYDQIDDLNNLLDVAIREFKDQLLGQLPSGGPIPGEYWDGYRAALEAASEVIRDAEYR